MTVECIAPHLAIGDHVDAGPLLQRHGFIDGPILDAFELRVSQIS
jgi:hypothetical protein